MLVYDNIDRREETISGGNTSHRVNGIIIQPKTEDQHHLELPSIENPLSEEDPECSVYITQKAHRRSLAGYMPTVCFDYIPGKRVGPQVLQFPSYDDKVDLVLFQRRKYFVWSMLRMVNPTSQYIPSWTGFNIQMRANVPIMQSNIGYLEPINNPATDIATVYEMMKRVYCIKDRLGLPSIVCVLDQAMYAKACEIKFKHKYEFKDVVLFLGTFHTLMMILGVAGKRFGDAGFKDVIIQSGIIEEGSIEGVLSGKMYNRFIYAHKMFYEALQRLLIKLFFTWLENEDLSNQYGNETMHSLFEDLCPERFESVINSAEFQRYHADYQRFINDLKCENSSLTTFWLSYIDLVSLIFDVIYSTRVGDWNLFVESIRNLTVWAFAYDRYNYSRYLLVFLGDIMRLPSSHPDVYDAILSGNFSVQLSDNTFGRNEADKTIENTVNKDTKTSGGLTGFSLNQAASNRWMLNASRRAECYRNLRDLVSFSGSKYSHHDLSKTRIKKDEHNVQAVVSIFETTFF